MQAASRLRDFRPDPRQAEEYLARQERLDRDRLAQQAEQGEIAAQGISALGDSAASTITGGISGFQSGMQQGREAQAHQRRMQLSEEDLADQQAQRPIRNQMQQIGLQRAEEELKQLKAGKKGNEAVQWSHTGQIDEQGRPIMFNRITGEYKSGDIKTRTKEEKPATPRLITYSDEKGNTVQEFVEPKAGEKFSARPQSKTAQEKTEKETKYRYDNLKSNANKLRTLVNKYGTVETTGSAGGEMDRLIYEMAIDYAKLVDPDSVAREGEVNAAQKYMLPIRNEALGVKGAGGRNETALQGISNYERALDDRLKSRGMTPTVTAVQGAQDPGTATAAPDEKIIGGKRYRKVPGGWEEVGP